MAKLTSRYRSHRYQDADGVFKFLRLGETINPSDLGEGELERARALGVFADEKEDAPASDFNAADASAEEVAEHIKKNKLNVKQTVALMGDDPELAEKILEAEAIATGRDPRKGVMDAASDLIDEEEEEEEE